MTRLNNLKRHDHLDHRYAYPSEGMNTVFILWLQRTLGLLSLSLSLSFPLNSICFLFLSLDPLVYLDTISLAIFFIPITFMSAFLDTAEEAVRFFYFFCQVLTALLNDYLAVYSQVIIHTAPLLFICHCIFCCKLICTHLNVLMTMPFATIPLHCYIIFILCKTQ